jgi:hypothetical protein
MNNNFEGVTFKEDAGKPDAPKQSSFAVRFLIAFFVYLIFFLIPVYVGFGVDVNNMAGVVLPSILFSALMALGGTDK